MHALEAQVEARSARGAGRDRGRVRGGDGDRAQQRQAPIKIGVLSDCQGAFGAFDNQDMAGVVTAMVQYAGAKAKNPNKPRDGWVGGQINGHPLKLVGVGCSQRPRRHGDQGDEAPDGAAGRGHHDRSAVG